MFEKGHFNNFDQTLTFSSIVPRLPYPTAWQSGDNTTPSIVYCSAILYWKSMKFGIQEKIIICLIR